MVSRKFRKLESWKKINKIPFQPFVPVGLDNFQFKKKIR